MSLRFNIIILSGLLAASWLPAGTQAVAPSDDARQRWVERGILDQKLQQWHDFETHGGCAADHHSVHDKSDGAFSFAASQQPDSAHLLVILVEFTDHAFDGQSVSSTAYDFDSLLFADTGRSMRTYFSEVSYGRFAVGGEVVGPLLMPNSYASYVGTNSGLTGSPLLARHAVDAAKSQGIDFSRFDTNDDVMCDGVMIIHPGEGAETGDENAIWSHKSSVFGEPVYDGIKIKSYTMNPEERGREISGIGVYCHEYGHILGLPDLYDVSGNPAGNGIGNFGLMGTGSWLGYGRLPAHLSAWSKMHLGWLQPIELSENIASAAIPQAATDPVAYLLRPDYGSEYWLVENRQRVGYDKLLPGAGLCIYHVDESRFDNSNAAAYLVAVEQADGYNAMNVAGSSGDAGDFWPGSSNNRNFHDQTLPSSKSNDGATTQIGVWNISGPDSVMYADLDISFSRPYIQLQGDNGITFIDSPGGDGDGIFEAGETIAVELALSNFMRPVHNVRVSLSGSSTNFVMPRSDDPLIDFLDNRIMLISGPLSFRISDSLVPTIESLSITVTADSLAASGGGEFETTFVTDISLGNPQLLIVDDDRGADFESTYTAALNSLKLPHDVWTVEQNGKPDAASLQQYRTVIWFTGDSTNSALNNSDAASIRSYLDSGGNLILSTISGASDLAATDASQLPDYFGADLAGSDFSPWIIGADGGFTSDLEFVYRTTGPPSHSMTLFETVGNGREELGLYFGSGPETSACVGVSYDGGGFRTVLLSLPLEYVGDRYNSPADFLERALLFVGAGAMAAVQTSTGGSLPQSYRLHQNYPNPFNPTTSISYELSYGRTREVKLELFNTLGRRVDLLVDQRQPGGRYTVTWDGRNSRGERAASGVYFYRLTVDDQSSTRKMVLLK